MNTPYHQDIVNDYLDNIPYPRRLMCPVAYPPKGWKHKCTYAVQEVKADSTDIITPPYNFLTDGGSIPDAVDIITFGRFPKRFDSRIVDLFTDHDWDFWAHITSVSESADRLYEGCRSRGVSKRSSWLIRQAVKSSIAKKLWENDDKDYLWMALWSLHYKNQRHKDQIGFPDRALEVADRIKDNVKRYQYTRTLERIQGVRER